MTSQPSRGLLNQSGNDSASVSDFVSFSHWLYDGHCPVADNNLVLELSVFKSVCIHVIFSGPSCPFSLVSQHAASVKRSASATRRLVMSLGFYRLVNS